MRKMPFHHVRAGLLYPDNYLSGSLAEGTETFKLTSISAEELGEIREAFRVLDRDGNGFISKQELGMAMRSLGYMPSEVELAIIMQRLDMDGDGQVDFEEFMTILGPKLLSSENREGFLGNTIDNIFWQCIPRRRTGRRACGKVSSAPSPWPSSSASCSSRPIRCCEMAWSKNMAMWPPGVDVGGTPVERPGRIPAHQ
ncbi:calcium-binding protein 8-like isoform X3 [Phyllopteryx taeniolatus]|uniref:calcium-binding protein 8-like isoform X3 n=1 Tax=Phyllopteryx taeniolatus TaxID=161469 RepID=UPI002AD50594|nr:calcium-binding protein 8-like isoform X3 [Phyllopteryx taeniolatus]